MKGQFSERSLLPKDPFIPFVCESLHATNCTCFHENAFTCGKIRK